MRSTCLLVLSILTAMTTGSALATSRTPDGADIPELTVLLQTVDGDTTGEPSHVSALTSAACSAIGAVPGPDVVYTWLATTDNPNFPLHLDFLVGPRAGFDVVVYALGELDNGASCVAAVDLSAAGESEMLHVEEQLTPGHRYYLYIDSRNGAAGSGAFQLVVSTFIPVELQSFTIE